MTTAIILLAILIAVLYALQRNHRNQDALWSSRYGSTTAEDRDIERVRAELAAATRSPDPSPDRSSKKSRKRASGRSGRPTGRQARAA